jgi:hypothetical protein
MLNRLEGGEDRVTVFTEERFEPQIKFADSKSETLIFDGAAWGESRSGEGPGCFKKAHALMKDSSKLII